MGNGTQDEGKPGRSLLSWVIPYNFIPYILYYVHAYSFKKSFGKDRVKACFQNFWVERDQRLFTVSSFIVQVRKLRYKSLNILSRSHGYRNKPFPAQIHTLSQAGGNFPQACNSSVTFLVNSFFSYLVFSNVCIDYRTVDSKSISHIFIMTIFQISLESAGSVIF